MLLLNQAVVPILGTSGLLFTFQYASIKPVIKGHEYTFTQRFTFQYASIKPN